MSQDFAGKEKGGRVYGDGMDLNHPDYLELLAIADLTGTPVEQVGGPPLGEVPTSPIPPQE